MSRINGLTKLIFSHAELKPPGFAQYEGASADILRSIVVFLHAIFEVLLRSRAPRLNKSWTFYSRADIDKALTRAAIDVAAFKPLYPPLMQMAKRRKRIVHEADLHQSGDPVLEAWNVTDHWQLIMWNLAVVAFYYQMLISTDTTSEAERVMYQKVREAMTGYVDFGKQLIAFGGTPKERWIEALQEMSDTLNNTLATLKCDVSAFLK